MPVGELGRILAASLWSSELPTTEVDLFASEPLAFEEAYGRALRADLGAFSVTVAAIDDLIALTPRGRPKDLEDIRALEEIQCESEGDRD
jgi:hypothetical protein